MKLKIQIKDPDLICDYVQRTARSEKARQEMFDTFFEFGDYGMLELDTKTQLWRWLPLEEW